MITPEHNQVLDPDFVVVAYRNGYFPMADSRTGSISWYSPDPRAIIPLTTFKISRSLRQVVRKRVFEIKVDTSFQEVIRACARREETWISAEIIRVYEALHVQGLAHSIEAWQGPDLVGGLYGVVIGGAFFGESMFSRVSNASKVALVHLVRLLKEQGFRLLDTQFMNVHLKQFGACEIPRTMYLKALHSALVVNAEFRN